MKIITLFLFFSFFIGFSNPVENNITFPKSAPECTVTVSVTPISCTTDGVSSNDGKIVVKASEASDTEIHWSTTTMSPLKPNAWEQNNLMAGEYTIEVLHKGASVYKKTHLVEAPDNFEITVEKTDNQCYSGEEGRIDITTSGGTPPFQYSISTPEIHHENSNGIFEDLSRGAYAIVVKDARGCTVTEKETIGGGRHFSVDHDDPLTTAPCLSQQEIDDAFAAWLSGFKYSGGNEPIKESYTHDPIPGPCGGSIVVTYTAVDNCGVEKSCESTFTVPKSDDLEITTEVKPMVVSCEDDTESVFQQWLTNHGNLTATSICDVSWTNNYTPELWENSCENSKTITVTFTASNGCMSSETTATFSIEDNTPPVLSSTPEDITVSCDQIPNAEVLTAIDSCDDKVSVTFNEMVTSDGCSNSIERVWTATDCSGNTTTHTQTITIEDKAPPSFVETLPIDLTVSCGQIPEAEVLTATDNCNNTESVYFKEMDTTVSVTFNEMVTSDGCSNSIERVWTATDCSGNTTTHTQTITIEDKVPPSFVETLPTDLTVSCGQIPEAEVLTAIDNCNNAESVYFKEMNTSVSVTFNEMNTTVSVTFNEMVTSDGCSNSIERVWTATDCSGNTTTHTQTITIEDKVPPSFVETLPTDLTVSCGQIPEVEVLTAIDNCNNTESVYFKEMDTTVSVTFNEMVTSDGCSNIIERVWTATDCSGNTTTHTQTITIEDKVPPSFVETLPTDLTVSCGKIPEAEVLTATDNCNNTESVNFKEMNTPVSVTFNEMVTSDGCSNIIERVWTATDCSGNTTTHTQTITIEDKEPPSFVETLPSDLTVSCGQIPEAEVLTAIDNCNNTESVYFKEMNTTVSVTFNEMVTSDGCSNSIERVWTATDCSGNTTTHTQTITIEDKVPPSFVETLPTDLTVSCGQIPEAEVLTAIDNCNNAESVYFKEMNTSVSVTFNEMVTSDGCSNIIERVWTATDCSGNTTTHTQTITIEDKAPPSFVETLPTDLTVSCGQIPEAEVLTAIDNCDYSASDHFKEMNTTVSVTFNEMVTSDGCSNIIERVWTATDCSGNTSTHTQTITIEDKEAPTLTAASLELFQEEITTSCANIPATPELAFQDQCSEDLKVNFEETSTYVDDQTDYEIQRVWQVTDPCNNQSTFTQTVKVNQHNTQQDIVEIMLCQRDAAYDLSALLPPSSITSGQWTLSTQDNYLSGSFFDPTTAVLGVYTAYYTLDDACTPETIVTITVHDDCVVLPCDSSQSVSISKAITPNGDPYNEYFTVSGLEDCGFKLELQVFNRWGSKIFESMDYQNNWNAFSNSSNSQFMPAGTYYYILTVVDSGYDPIKGYVYVGTTAK